MTRNDIGWAVKQMFNGGKVRRRGWAAVATWLEIQLPDACSKMTQPYIFSGTSYGRNVPWTPSQADILATDWELFHA